MQRNHGEQRTVPWAARLLAALLCAGALLAMRAGAAEARDKPTSTAAKRGAESTLRLDRAEAAAELQAAVTLRSGLAMAGGAAAFTLAAAGIWWLSARWLRRRALQWAALIAIPTLVALSVVASSRGGVVDRLDDLPASLLRDDLADPYVSAEPEKRAALLHALSLHAAANQGHLLGTLALVPTLLTFGGALLVSLLLWQVTHRRVLQTASASHA
jgi:hypothetical protein